MGGVHSVQLPPSFCWGGGVEPQTKFPKKGGGGGGPSGERRRGGGGLERSQFLERDNFFKGVWGASVFTYKIN